jgi:hypothetical protein
MFQFPEFASYPYVFKIRYLIAISRNHSGCSLRATLKGSICPHAVAARGRFAPDGAPHRRRRPFGLALKAATAFSEFLFLEASRAKNRCEAPQAQSRAANRLARHRSPSRSKTCGAGREIKQIETNHSNRNDFLEIKGGLPHSEIRGSKLIRSSPRLIAAYHVLHRLCMPRHPPDALKTLDRSHCQ